MISAPVISAPVVVPHVQATQTQLPATVVAQNTDESAKVTFVVPTGARLFVNDVAVAAQGSQTFDTPKLTQGKTYYYTVKAELNRDGQAVTDIRRIDVAAGKALTVDFTKAEARQTASR